MKLKGKIVSAHGYFIIDDIEYPRRVISKFIERKGGIFKKEAFTADLLIFGKPNRRTKFKERSKIYLMVDRDIEFISAKLFYTFLSPTDKKLLNKLNV